VLRFTWCLARLLALGAATALVAPGPANADLDLSVDTAPIGGGPRIVENQLNRGPDWLEIWPEAGRIWMDSNQRLNAEYSYVGDLDLEECSTEGYSANCWAPGNPEWWAEVTLGAGDDSISVARGPEGQTMPFRWKTPLQDDTDSVFGPGNDNYSFNTPGVGDAIAAGNDNDYINVKDGNVVSDPASAKDVADCGPGYDRVRLDVKAAYDQAGPNPPTIDAVHECERLVDSIPGHPDVDLTKPRWWDFR
jgi:hypothetical protein